MKMEKETKEIVLKKCFYIFDEEKNKIVEINDPPFPWEDQKITDFVKRKHEHLSWHLNTDIASVFPYSEDIDIKSLLKYLENNKEKFEKWFKEYSDVKFCRSECEDYREIVYIVGRREETDEEFDLKVKAHEEEKKQKFILSEKRKEEKLKKEKALFETLKKKYGEE